MKKEEKKESNTSYFADNGDLINHQQILNEIQIIYTKMIIIKKPCT